jgi:hypothetical protein
VAVGGTGVSVGGCGVSDGAGIVLVGGLTCGVFVIVGFGPLVDVGDGETYGSSVAVGNSPVAVGVLVGGEH